MTSPIGSNNPIDQLYSTNKKMRAGNEGLDHLTQGCKKSAKVGMGMGIGGIVGGGLATAIPPPGAFTIPGGVIGALIGLTIGESCSDDSSQ